MTLRWSVLLLLPLLVAMGASDRLMVKGLVSVVGNEPFTWIALSDRPNHAWRLEGEPVNELRTQAQGARVLVWGTAIDGDTLRVERWKLDEEGERYGR